MGSTTLLVLRLGVLLLLFLIFLALERRRRGVLVVLLVMGLTLVDATLYADTTASAERSIFHPMLFGQSFRLSQLIIPLALLARAIVHGLPRRFDASALFWAAFFAWMLTAAGVGLLAGHDPNLVMGEGTMIIHVGGMILLAGGVPAEDYVNGRALERFFQAAAVMAAGLFALDVLRVRLFSEAIPDLPLVNLGNLGGDAATLFSAVGVVALVLGVARRPYLGRRAALIVPGAVLVLSHLASSQRAARLGLYVTLLVVLVIACLPTARRRLGFTLGQVGFAATCVAAIGFAVAFVPAVAGVVAPQSVVATANADEFAPTSRQGSIQSRFNQWDVVLERIGDEPLLGEGLGGTFVSFSEGHKRFVDSDISHNIILDLTRRAGVVGVTLAGAALLAVWAQALGTWRFHPSTQVAALAAAASAATVGLLAKGMVESIFEKDRLAVLLGFLIGLTVSAAMSWLNLGSVTRQGPVPGSVRQLAR